MTESIGKSLIVRPIGAIRTPYTDWAPQQPLERDAEPGRFRIEVDSRYATGLEALESFSHVFVLSWLDRSPGEAHLKVKPPWAGGLEVGLFASRSPRRPNPLGLHVVRLLGRRGTVLEISPIDCLDETPLLDLKPYIRDLDARSEANHGWIEDLGDAEHLIQHLRGAPHDHGDGHDHHHHHDHRHDHHHDHD